MKTSGLMRTVACALLSLLTCPSYGQDTARAPAAKAACGPERVKFNVSLDRRPRPPLQPAEGKSLIYVFQEYPNISLLGSFTMKVGLDGAWVGANQKRSYLAFAVEPGVHHLCVSGQGGLWPPVSLVRVVAKPDKTYYFGTQFYCTSRGDCYPLDVRPVDEDQANLLIQTSSFSSSHPK